jgi:hypothetical protein
VERELGKAGFIGLGWPTAAGGRGASLMQQVIWSEEYTRAQAPVRVSHIAEHLLAPTVIAFGTPAMQERFLPPILRGDERWCQVYSEPNAGSDLANMQTKPVLDGEQWVINGQKVWTSLAVGAVVLRDRAAPSGSQRHKGLVPARAHGPARHRDPPHHPDHRWRRVQRGVLHRRARAPISSWAKWGKAGASRWACSASSGVSTLAQQLTYERELAGSSTSRGAAGSRIPVILRGWPAWIGVRIIRLNALRSMAEDGVPGEVVDVRAVLGHVARDLGNLTMDILGAEGMIARRCPTSSREQKAFLFSRADTIYGRSNRSSATCWASACSACREPQPQ